MGWFVGEPAVKIFQGCNPSINHPCPSNRSLRSQSRQRTMELVGCARASRLRAVLESLHLSPGFASAAAVGLNCQSANCEWMTFIWFSHEKFHSEFPSEKPWKKLPSLKLTVRPWKSMVGRRSFPFGPTIFSGANLFIIPKNPIREHNNYHGYTVRGTPGVHPIAPWIQAVPTIAFPAVAPCCDAVDAVLADFGLQEMRVENGGIFSIWLGQ